MSKKSSTFARFFRRWAPCAREKTFVENAFGDEKRLTLFNPLKGILET